MSEETATSSAPTSSSTPATSPVRSVTLEFTVEPFTDSEPGPHVTAAIATATQNHALAVEVGPFGTIVTGSENEVFKTTQQILVAAFEQGASRVSMQVNAQPS